VGSDQTHTTTAPCRPRDLAMAADFCGHADPPTTTCARVEASKETGLT
jgi:hypothetical protein